MGALLAACALAALGRVAAGPALAVKTLALEHEHALRVGQDLEYILRFVPTEEQSRFPSRVWLSGGGGDAARPLLVTARQRTGAITWQLPYYSGASLLFELERTLCLDDAADETPADCADTPERRGEFSLHVGSACAASELRLRVAPARDWLVSREGALATLSPAAPSVNRYAFAPDEDSVRLVVSSDDDVCATLAVQEYSCPIVQTPEEMEGATVLMTVWRSGGVQLARSRYPRGFYVIGATGDSDEACTGEPTPDSDWLWEEAVWPGGAAPRGSAGPPARVKRLTLEIKPSLSRAQYLTATLVTAAVFLTFYVAFGALVVVQRWPRWRRLVGPRAVLASAPPEAAVARRRDSDATFDSSDISDSDSERAASPAEPAPAAREAAPPESGGTGEAARPESDGAGEAVRSGPGGASEADGARPFGLPVRLHVAALARRRGRVLRARSDRYLYALYTVAVFYALPVVQFVAAFQLILNASGSLDLCYYNFLCAHPLGALSDFNHVFSNLGYLLLGALFLLQLRRRRWRRERRPRDEEYGIPQHYGLLSSLGAGMMVVALLSASYHVCPNRLNFQFDTAFMYVLAVLLVVKIYQSRHPDINARAHATFGVLAALIALVVWGVLGGGPLFWSVFTVLHVFTFLLLSLRIYYVGQFRLGKDALAETARALRRKRPLYTPRLVALLLANAVNWAFALYGLVTQSSDIASHLLFVLLCNALLYIVFYLSMKLLHGERPRWYAWAYLAGAAAAWAPALYFFLSGSTSWATTPALSRHLNHECRVLAFYDAHDLWHALSAVALFLTFNAVLTWDDGLSAVKRTDIAVF